MARGGYSKHAEPLEGEGGDAGEKGESYPGHVDDVEGCSKYASQPDDVKGHAGNLQSAEEARNL